jgi:hypothetical protein
VADAKEPPLRVIFGGQAVDIASAIYERRLAKWTNWKPLSVSAQA